LKLHPLWILSDGKPGHENQSLGLAEAMVRLTPCSVHVLRLSPADGWISRIRHAVKLAAALPRPRFIIAAGHSTHLPLCWLAKSQRATSVVLMKPSLPLACFGVCIAPQHDFPGPKKPANLITTRGALNRVLPGPPDRKGKLILIGGPSKTHGWDTQSLIRHLATITSESGPWLLTDSRRTPPDFLPAAQSALPNVEFHPHTTTPPGWVPSHLADSAEVWVTEDSVSMIYESLTSGARVGLLPCPRLKSTSRVISGLDALVADGFLTPFDIWKSSRNLPHQPTPLREADRCAKLLLQHQT
jgi:mitochondrial fission protein ELM1